MRRFWDAVIVLAIALFLIKLMVDMIRPYVPYAVIGAAVLLAAKYIHKRNTW